MSPPGPPYLSIIATTRNDDHGGSLLRRTQTFLNALISQLQRHAIPSELIIVEWNPPPDRPRLRDALRGPAAISPCQVRIVEVPPSIHARYQHAAELPLYQMIAKNTGIRRARGEFVLATNIDVLFSDELMEFIAARQLDPGCFYRIDRYDVMTHVPVDAPVEDQLAYCRNHLLRINRRAGAHYVTPEGFPALAPKDIVDPGAGILLGEGWFPSEMDGNRPFRWVENDAAMTVSAPPAGERALVFEIAAGPSMGSDAFDLAFVDEGGRVLAQTRIEGDSVVTLQLPAGDRFSFRLRTPQGGLPIPDNPRILNFRVFRCEWQPSAQLPSGDEARCASRPAGNLRRAARLARKVVGVLRRAAEDGPVISVWVPVPRLARRFLRFCFGLPAVDPAEEKPQPVPIPVPADCAPAPAICAPAYLHTWACGDFTLMHRRHWFALRGYAELDLYSFHLDSVLCYAAYHSGLREVVLPDPMRIYHIEHGRGSGWSPEGEKQLFERLRRQGVGWLEYDQVIAWAAQMRRLGCPMIFNLENWGLSEFDLPEIGLS